MSTTENNPGAVPPPPPNPSGSMSPGDERLWGMLAHLSTFLMFATGLGQYIAPLVGYFVFRDKSKFVAFHCLQAVFFHVVISLFIAIPTAVTCGFAIFVVGPVGLIAAIVWPIIAGLAANKGEWYEYPYIGGWVKNIVKADR